MERMALIQIAVVERTGRHSGEDSIDTEAVYKRENLIQRHIGGWITIKCMCWPYATCFYFVESLKKANI